MLIAFMITVTVREGEKYYVCVQITNSFSKFHSANFQSLAIANMCASYQNQISIEV